MSGNVSVIKKGGTILDQDANDIKTKTNFKVYNTRWLMLFLFVMCYACTAFQFLQFSIIANIIVDFYGVSYEAVDWSVLIQFLVYVAFIFPAMHIMNKIGIRESLIITMIGICAAAWLKVGTAAPDRFWLVMVAQVFVSFSQVFISVQPARLASAWFGSKETALACGIGVFGDQLGITMGCFIPIILVKDSKNKNAIAYDMNVLNIGLAVVCTVVFILTLAFFKSEPKTPPSGAQEQLENFGKTHFKDSTILLYKNRSYVLLLVAYALSIGVFYVIPTLLNQIILQYYPNSLQEVGKIGLIINIMGVVASAVSGYVLSKLQRYRLITVSTFALYLVGMIMFTLAPFHSLTTVYIASIVLGFFMTSTYSVCLDVAAELTYPVPESTSSGYLIASSQLLGIIFVYLYSFILYNFGAFWSNIVTCIELLISTILIVCMKFQRKRQAADNIYSMEEQELKL